MLKYDLQEYNDIISKIKEGKDATYLLDRNGQGRRLLPKHNNYY
jgi:hypothetical protein